MNDTFYIGTDLKFLLDIQAEGFSMTDDDFSVTLTCANKSVELQKEDIATDGDGNYYLLVDTTQFGNGTLVATVKASVPDDDFPSGIRHEVAVIGLCIIKE